MVTLIFHINIKFITLNMQNHKKVNYYSNDNKDHNPKQTHPTVITQQAHIF